MLRTRMIQTAGVLVGAVALTTMVGGGSAWAGSSITLHDKATGHCLDSNSSGDAYALQCNGGSYQHWYDNSYGGGTVYFQDVQTGRCLTTGTQINSNLVMMQTSSLCYDNAVNFSIIFTSDGTETFTTGKWCLDSNANGKGNNVGTVYMDPCNGGDYQRFTIGG